MARRPLFQKCPFSDSALRPSFCFSAPRPVLPAATFLQKLTALTDVGARHASSRRSMMFRARAYHARLMSALRRLAGACFCRSKCLPAVSPRHRALLHFVVATSASSPSSYTPDIAGAAIFDDVVTHCCAHDSHRFESTLPAREYTTFHCRRSPER